LLKVSDEDERNYVASWMIWRVMLAVGSYRVVKWSHESLNCAI
jgi:hypothetical protein